MRGFVPYAWRGLVARPARSVLTDLRRSRSALPCWSRPSPRAPGWTHRSSGPSRPWSGRADLRVAAFAETGLSDATLQALDAVPGVALTAPAIERRAFIGSAPGRPIVTEPVTVLGIDPTREPRVRDLVVVRGEPLPADGRRRRPRDGAPRGHGGPGAGLRAVDPRRRRAGQGRRDRDPRGRRTGPGLVGPLGRPADRDGPAAARGRRRAAGRGWPARHHARGHRPRDGRRSRRRHGRHRGGARDRAVRALGPGRRRGLDAGQHGRHPGD